MSKRVEKNQTKVKDMTNGQAPDQAPDQAQDQAQPTTAEIVAEYDKNPFLTAQTVIEVKAVNYPAKLVVTGNIPLNQVKMAILEIQEALTYHTVQVPTLRRTAELEAKLAAEEEQDQAQDQAEK